MNSLSYVSESNNPSKPQPLPRTPRKRRTAKVNRGLPPDAELKKLAQEYLRFQTRLWPEMNILKESDNRIDEMVEDFKLRHRTGKVDLTTIATYVKLRTKLGGAYCRYSCDNSNPNSIIDQLAKILDKARTDNRFIPWSFVFADYSVTGLSPSRRGYNSYKNVLKCEEYNLDSTYIDDFTRASRDELEWWRLASLSRKLSKRMIGASDGFDLSSPNSDIMITVFGLISRLFLKSLREKVNRGMQGAARRGGILGKLPLGFTRIIKDASNQLNESHDLALEYMICIDPETADSRRLMYELYVEKCWSIGKITRHFNLNKIDGWEGWTRRGITNLLQSATAIGVFIWNRTRSEYDHEQQRMVKVANPRKEWVIHYDRNLSIVPIDLWIAARKKLSASRRKSPNTGRNPSRNQKSATTLLSGTLMCEYCESELKLIRSTPKYKMMGCLNGANRGHQCKLTTSKSTRIIEKCILDYIQENVLTESRLDELLKMSNEYLTSEGVKPQTDTAPLKRLIRNKEDLIAKHFDRIENTADPSVVQAYEKRISDVQRELDQLKLQLREMDHKNEPPPPPLDRDTMMELLKNARELFNQEVPAAAEVIRELTGPIKIHQETTPGKRGGKWIATFSPDFLGFIRKQSRNTDCPDSVTLEYLSSRIWTTPLSVSVQIDHTMKYEQISPIVADLVAKGFSINTIAAANGWNWDVTNDAWKFATTGQRPKMKQGQKRYKRSSTITRKVIDPAEVVRLRDEELCSFIVIANKLGISSSRVTRLYDRAKPNSINNSIKAGQKPRRGRYSHLGPKKYEKIRELLGEGKSIEKIASELGIGKSTVYREKEKCDR